MATKFLQTSDLHIGSGSSIKGNFERQEEVLKDIVRIAEEHNVDAYLIPGDLFDKAVVSRGSEDLILRFLLADKRPKFITTGNHDYLKSQGKSLDQRQPQLSFLKIISRHIPHLIVTLKKPMWTEFNGIPIFMVPYLHKKSKYADVRLDKKCILMMHDTIKGATFENCWEPDKGIIFDPRDDKHIIYGAIGHVHKWQMISDRICYGGSPYQVKFDEELRKTVNIITLEGKEVSKIKRVDVKSRKLRHKVVKSKQDIEDIKDDSDSIYKVDVDDPKLGGILPENVASFDFVPGEMDQFSFKDNLVVDFKSYIKNTMGIQDKDLRKEASRLLKELLANRGTEK